MGNTVSIIAAQKAVGDERVSVATGTMVTMFNIGGSIGLALAVVVYQAVTSHALNANRLQLTGQQMTLLTNLTSNPANSLQTTLTSSMRALFNSLFLQGFSGVMCFLFVLASLAVLGVWSWKMMAK